RGLLGDLGRLLGDAVAVLVPVGVPAGGHRIAAHAHAFHAVPNGDALPLNLAVPLNPQSLFGALDHGHNKDAVVIAHGTGAVGLADFKRGGGGHVLRSVVGVGISCQVTRVTSTGKEKPAWRGGFL